MQYLTCLRRLATVSALALASVAPAQTNYSIYNDGLVNGFKDWSWTSRNLMNTSPAHSGIASISVSAKPWEGLYFRRDEFIVTSNYASLSFWANGGERGGQYLMLRPVWDGVVQEGRVLPMLPANEWQRLTLPLETVGAANRTNFQGLQIQLCDGVTNTFYVDDIQLDVKAAPVSEPAKEAATPVQGAIATPPSARHSATAEPTVRPGAKADQATDQAIWWIVGSLAAIIALLGFLVFLFWKRGPASPTSLQLSPPHVAQVSPSTAEEWRQRALVAEAMAGKQGQMLREKIMPELTEFAKQSLVQGLYTQRNTLIETQGKAQLALAELESRLAGLQLPLQERIRAYEKRITELEKEVESQGEEMRELTHVTLVLMRKKLEDERERERTDSRFS